MAYINFPEAQVVGSIVTLVFAIMLYALTLRRLRGVTKVSALLMCAGFFLTSMQFALQRLFQFHTVDLAMGFSVNLAFFMLVSYLLYTAVLYLLRQGRLTENEWRGVPVAWLCCVLSMAFARIYYGEDARNAAEQQVLQRINYVTAVVYAVELLYLFRRLQSTYRKMRSNIEESFDRSTQEMIGWVNISMRMMTTVSFCLPLCLFFRTELLILFLYFVVFILAYLAVTFTFFSVSNDAVIAAQAEEMAREEEAEEDAEAARVSAGTRVVTGVGEAIPSVIAVVPEPEPLDMDKVNAVMAQWLKEKGYAEHNLSIKVVAGKTELKVWEIRRWLAETKKGTFSQWLSRLRTDYAKELLEENPTWGLDVVADQCGFTNRQSFSRAFKNGTGCNPTEWAGANAG